MRALPEKRNARSTAAVPVVGASVYMRLQSGKTKREGCRLIQEEQVGQDQDVKVLECHEKIFRVYYVDHRKLTY